MLIADRPKWLSDYPDIESCLNQFLDKLDKVPAQSRLNDTIRRAIDRKTFPTLWRQGDESDIQWQFILALEKEYKLWKVKEGKRGAFDPAFENASVHFLIGSENFAEETVRSWLNRPYEEPQLLQWRQSIEKRASEFPGSTERLAKRPFLVAGKTHHEVVNAFSSIGAYQHEQLTLRRLSARCFWGISKVLDNHEELLLSLYPDLDFKVRPLIIDIHIPTSEEVIGYLFIENYDSYVNALQGNIEITKGYILIYCAGFLGSASRIRQKYSVVFHYSSDSQLALKEDIENWWLDDVENNVPVCFWGDLDFSGMGILAALKKTFPKIKAWKPGYEKMLCANQNQQAHEAVNADKNNQQDPQITGCTYADTVLLPTLRSSLLFVDQEII